MDKLFALYTNLGPRLFLVVVGVFVTWTYNLLCGE